MCHRGKLITVLSFLFLRALSSVLVDTCDFFDDIMCASKDPDPSIRLRALDLIFQLVSKNNARALVAELLNYLVVAPAEQKRDMCSKILQVRSILKVLTNFVWRVASR